MLTSQDGKFLLKLARASIETYVKERKRIPVPKEFPENLKKRQGIFVTIYRMIGKIKELRGCIGLPYPEKPLIEGCIEAAISASKDPRFLPLKSEELKNIKLEISVLTEPELIKVSNPKEYLEKIKIGKDGLIIQKGIMSGLLLPQVPVEYKWKVKEYLENLCIKAGLSIDSWMDPAVEIYKFQAQIFEE